MLSTPKKPRLSQKPVDKSVKYGILKLPYNKYSSKLNEMRISNQLCDIKIVARNGEEFLAHKVLLAVSSEYFNDMFNRGFKEFTESEIVIHEIDPHVLKLLIDFIYTSKLIVTEEYIQGILVGLCVLQFNKSIRNECISYFKSNIYASNCLNMKELAKSLGLTYLYSLCSNYILDNYMELIDSEEFVLITYDQILGIIKNNDLCCKEELVYLSVIKWIKHDLNNRSRHLAQLLEYVRLPLVSPEFLKFVDEEPLLKNKDCVKFLTEAHAVQTVNDTGLEISNSIRTQYRPNYARYILIISNIGRKNYPLLFNIETDKWKTVRVMIPNYSGATSVMLKDGRIINIGGVHTEVGTEPSLELLERLHWDFEEEYDFVQNMNKSSIYDVTDNHWLELPPMYGNHSLSNIVQIGTRVYVVGRKFCEYYDIELNEWIKIKNFISEKTSCEIITLDGLIYRVGGRIKGTEVNDVQIYNPEKNVWSKGPSMLYKKSSPTLCVLKNCIYAIGGRIFPNIYLDVVEKYDPLNETWVKMGSLNRSRCRAGAVAMNGQIYVFGGANSNCTIEVYCPYKNKWTMMSSKIPKILGCNNMCSAFVVKPNIENKFVNSTIDII